MISWQNYEINNNYHIALSHSCCKNLWSISYINENGTSIKDDAYCRSNCILCSTVMKNGDNVSLKNSLQNLWLHKYKKKYCIWKCLLMHLKIEKPKVYESGTMYVSHIFNSMTKWCQLTHWSCSNPPKSCTYEFYHHMTSH